MEHAASLSYPRSLGHTAVAKHELRMQPTQHTHHMQHTQHAACSMQHMLGTQHTRHAVRTNHAA